MNACVCTRFAPMKLNRRGKTELLCSLRRWTRWRMQWSRVSCKTSKPHRRWTAIRTMIAKHWCRIITSCRFHRVSNDRSCNNLSCSHSNIFPQMEQLPAVITTRSHRGPHRSDWKASLESSQAWWSQLGMAISLRSQVQWRVITYSHHRTRPHSLRVKSVWPKKAAASSFKTHGNCSTKASRARKAQ